MAHTHRPPSAPPAAPPPSRHCAAHRSPRDHPGAHPIRAGNVPTDWLAHSTRHTSATPHPAPPRWPRDHARPAPRTTRAHTHHADNPPPLHSTPSISDDARPQAGRQDLAPSSPAHGQAHRPTLPTPSPGMRISAPEPVAAATAPSAQNQTPHRPQKRKADNSSAHALTASRSPPRPLPRQRLLPGRYAGS